MRHRESNEFFSRELEDVVQTEEQVAEAKGEFELGGGWTGLASVSFSALDFDDQFSGIPPRVALFGRETLVSRAGVSYRFTRGVVLGAGLEDIQVAFDHGNVPLSNEGLNPFITFEYETKALLLRGRVTSQELEPRTTSGMKSLFPDFSETLGNVVARFQVRPSLELQFVADRRFIYSLNEEWAYYTETDYGPGIRWSLGPRAKLAVFVETGTNDYRGLSINSRSRSDDLNTLGSDATFRIGPGLLQLGWQRTEYDSTLPGLSRDITRYSLSFRFFSSGDSPWA